MGSPGAGGWEEGWGWRWEEGWGWRWEGACGGGGGLGMGLGPGEGLLSSATGSTLLLTTYRLALKRSEGGPVAQLDGELRRRLCDAQPDMRVHAQL